MKLFNLFLISILLFIRPAYSTEEYHIETSDIKNFWIAFDAIKKVDNKEQVFKELYQDKASDFFKWVLEMSGDMRNVNNYLESFSRYPKYWESLREPTLKMQYISDEIALSFERVKKAYPNFKPGDVGVVVTPMVVKGNADEGKITLGAELNARLDEVDLSEFEQDISFVFQNDIKSIIVHETIHLQQKSQPSTLLGHSIHEGSADFLAELFTNESYTGGAYDFGRANEKALWLEFSQEMHLPDYDRWLYGASKTEERPMDLGYFIGYSITKAYYDKAEDKDRAIKEIIEVTDFEKFLEDSGYSEKFSTIIDMHS